MAQEREIKLAQDKVVEIIALLEKVKRDRDEAECYPRIDGIKDVLARLECLGIEDL